MAPLTSLLLSPSLLPQVSPPAAAVVIAHPPRTPAHSGPNNLRCPTCGKVFTTQTGFKAHVDSHSGIYQYNCSYCQKGFTGKLALLEHTTSHTNINNFPCRLCEQTFRYAYRLKTHMRAMHSVMMGAAGAFGRGRRGIGVGRGRGAYGVPRCPVGGGGASASQAAPGTAAAVVS